MSQYGSRKILPFAWPGCWDNILARIAFWPITTDIALQSNVGVWRKSGSQPVPLRGHNRRTLRSTYELDKAEEVLSVEFPADEYAALPLYPGEETLDEPASHVAA